MVEHSQDADVHISQYKHHKTTTWPEPQGIHHNMQMTDKPQKRTRLVITNKGKETKSNQQKLMNKDLTKNLYLFQNDAKRKWRK